MEEGRRGEGESGTQQNACGFHEGDADLIVWRLLPFSLKLKAGAISLNASIPPNSNGFTIWTCVRLFVFVLAIVMFERFSFFATFVSFFNKFYGVFFIICVVRLFTLLFPTLFL